MNSLEQEFVHRFKAPKEHSDMSLAITMGSPFVYWEGLFTNESRSSILISKFPLSMSSTQ